MTAVPGQRAYEEAASAAASWAPRLLTWAELRSGIRADWAQIEAQQPLGARTYCFCLLTGPRVIEWSARWGAWAHTDGWPCSASKDRPMPAKDRPAPSVPEGALF